MKERIILAASLIGLGLPIAALSQVTAGSISGRIIDPSGRPVAGVTVAVADTLKATERIAATDATGLYRVPGLSPSTYRVSATKEGFSESITPPVRLAVDSHLRIDLQLQVAGMRQSVDVSAKVEALPVESSELGAVFDRERIAGLPLNRRDFLQLALLSPGIAPPVEDSELSTRGGFAMHAGGGREEYNNFLLDGADNNDPYVNRYVVQPSVDAIQEFKIVTNAYAAEYGRNAAGQVNVVTRSGTNEYHGTAYEYFRNRILDARNFFDDSAKPKFSRNQFGAGAGGPVVRERTFFFANVDFLRGRQGLSRLGSVPTASQREGDLSSLGPPVFDPFSRRPFPGNVIPAERISPVARGILRLFPLPNRKDPVANYLAQPTLREDVSQYHFRVDHRLSANDQLMARYSAGHVDLVEPFAEDTDAVDGFGDSVRDRGHNLALQHQRVISPAVVNSLRFGFSRFDRKLLHENNAVDARGLWGVDWIAGTGFPSFSVAGFSRVGDVTGLPLVRDVDTIQAGDTLSVIHGNHNLKLGGDFRRLSLDSKLELLTRGSISFSGALSQAGISDLLLGLPSFTLQAQADNPIRLRSSSLNLFLQDDWRLRHDLTLNLGVRYEYNTPATDPEDRMTTLDPKTGTIVRVGEGNTTRSGIHPDWNNVAPRIGFAWNPGASWVVRGGYGLHFDAGMFVVNSAQFFNPPQFNLRVFFPTAQSLITLSNPFPTGGGITPPPSLNVLNPDLSTSYAQHWSFNVQRTLAGAGTLSVAYAGSKGTKLIRSRNPNQPRPAEGPVQPRRPLPQYGSIFLAESGGNSSYNSLQAAFNRRFSRSLGFWLVYTYAKSIDDVSAFLGTKPDKNFPQDSLDFRAERGVSSFDIGHRAAISFVYALPLGHWLTRNTEFGGIVVLQSAPPFTPILRFDNSNTGNTGGTFGSDRPNLVGNPRLSNPSPERWFDTGVFPVAARYTFGSAGRNVVRGDGLRSTDVSLARTFHVGDRWRLRMEAQAFNLFNQANFDLPEMFADEAATFGRVFSAKASRQIQFALRLNF